MKAAAMAAAALLAAGAAQAQLQARATPAEMFCHDLRRMVRNAPDFEGMVRARPAPPWLGFRPGACRAHAATATLAPAYWCHQQLAPAHLAFDNLVAMTQACLPEAKLLPARWSRVAALEAPGIRIEINESGGPGAKVGRIVGFRVEAVNRPE